MNLYSLLGKHKTIAIVGMSKNCGKTTVLNALLSACFAMGECIALSSIGRDGEPLDLVSGTPKPSIFVRPGTLIATAQNLLRNCDITQEIIDTTDIFTPLGRIVLIRALSDGTVDVAGASITEQMLLVNSLLQTHGAQRVFIDGALSRRSPARSELADGIILCTGAAYSPSIEKIAADTAFIANLFCLGEDSSAAIDAADNLLTCVSKNPQARNFCVSGALTDKMILPLLQANLALEGLKLIVTDASKVLLSNAIYQRLIARGINLAVRCGARLLCIAINPTSPTGEGVDGASLISALAKRVSVPIINVRD